MSEHSRCSVVLVALAVVGAVASGCGSGGGPSIRVGGGALVACGGDAGMCPRASDICGFVDDGRTGTWCYGMDRCGISSCLNGGACRVEEVDGGGGSILRCSQVPAPSP